MKLFTTCIVVILIESSSQIGCLYSETWFLVQWNLIGSIAKLVCKS